MSNRNTRNNARRGGRKNSNKRRNRNNKSNPNRMIVSNNTFEDYKQFKYNNEKFARYYQPGRFAPDRTRMVMTFMDTTGTRTVTGSAPALNWGYQSSAYDPDPGFLTGSIPGYAEMSNLYREFCVHAIYAEVEVANQSTQSSILVAWPGTVRINTNSLTKDDLAEYAGNVGAKSVILGSVTGNNVGKMKFQAEGIQLIGRRFKTDLDFASLTNTNPVRMFFLNFGIYCPLANVDFPFVTKVRLHYDVEWFSLRQLES